MILIVLAFKFFFTPFQGMYLMLDVLSQNHTLGFTPLGRVHTLSSQVLGVKIPYVKQLFSWVGRPMRNESSF